MWLAIIESIKGLFFVLKFWGKRKEKKSRERSINAISDSKRYDSEYE